MSSSLQANLTGLLQGNYGTIAVIVAVGYDYVLTFPQEIEYIWTKPWTWVSTLFVCVRYFGIYNIMFNGLSEVAGLVSTWVFILFLGAADLVMLLRVWVMYNRSRLILSTLLVLFCMEIVALIIATTVGSLPQNAAVSVDQLLNYSFCVVGDSSPIWIEVATVFQVIDGTLMCLLATVQSVRETLQMYRCTQRWQLNQYIKLLAQQGLIYFAAMLIFQLVNALSALGKIPSAGWQMLLARTVQFVPVYTLTPRFILSMRRLYARDVNDHNNGEGIDSAFGLSSSTTGTLLVFADVEQNEVEVAPMDESVTEPAGTA